MRSVGGRRYAVVSCHVERPLDDLAWSAFARLQERRVGGLTVAALMRPPDERAGEDEGRWLTRAREAAMRGPLGHHTHWTGPDHARPTDGDPAERVAREGRWIREHGLRPTLFCGGGWYMDEAVADAVAELGYTDCTATASRPTYLDPGSPRIAATEPMRLVLSTGRELLELPTTHSLGAGVHAAVSLRRPRSSVLHVYFHDYDLLDATRRSTLVFALELLGRRFEPTDLDELSQRLALEAPRRPFALAP